MTSEALGLLNESPTAMRLVAAWPLVQDENPTGRMTKRMIREWAGAAGLSELDVKTWNKMLFRHGICLRGGGGVDPQAMAIVRHYFWQRLPKPVRAKEPPKEGG